MVGLRVFMRLREGTTAEAGEGGHLEQVRGGVGAAGKQVTATRDCDPSLREFCRMRRELCNGAAAVALGSVSRVDRLNVIEI